MSDDHAKTPLGFIADSLPVIHCAIHGTVATCPFLYMTCTEPGDPSDPRLPSGCGGWTTAQDMPYDSFSATLSLKDPLI